MQPLSLEELEYPDSTVLSPQSLPPTPRQPLEELPQNTPSTSTAVAHYQRFGMPSHCNDLNQLCKPTTKNNNSWATGVFRSWVAQRNANTNNTGESFPQTSWRHGTLLPSLTEHLLHLIEARRVDSDYYPGNTLNNILSALFRVMKEQQGAITWKSHQGYNFTLNLTMHSIGSSVCSAACSIGIERKRAQVITPDIQQQLWRMGVLGFHSPEALLNTMLFFNGQNFCLQGVQEHYNLCFTQIQYATNPERYIYHKFAV